MDVLAQTTPPPAVAPTAPPPATYSNRMNRERIDQLVLRSLGERRVFRTLRRNGNTSAWDGLEALVATAATTLWEVCPFESALGDDLAAFCAFMARELEINEQMDLPSDKDMARLQSLAPRALDALDAITAPLVFGDGDPATRTLARAFGAVRAELLSKGVVWHAGLDIAA
jgi:hypothetical protein